MKDNLEILKLYLKIETKLIFDNHIFINNSKMYSITSTRCIYLT